MELEEFIEGTRKCYLIAMQASEREDFDVVFARLDALEELMESGDQNSVETAKLSVYFETLSLVFKNRLAQLQESEE